ncbi:MAG: outer membrane beta-barrel family protein, partial [Muribaculaceae bacterium]|nr:outer membrane beta-barrel family protein [Muribaculaceae bacterium]
MKLSASPLVLLLAPCLGVIPYAAAQSQTPPAEAEPQLSEAQIDSLEQAAYGDVRDLHEIVVTADSPLVKVEGRQITYDVDQDPTAAGESVLDMLRKVPMVSVDGQDNIRLKGESGFKIYVNGRPDPTLSENASTILKAMPASAVSKVEVIADPGAKYDAEGTAGIINLVTERKTRQTGYNGSATLSASNRDISAGLFGAAKWNRLTLNANVNYMNSKMFTQSGSSYSSTLYPGNQQANLLISESDLPRKFEYLGASLSGSLELSDIDLINFSANYTNVDGSMDIGNNRTTMFSADGSEIWSFRRDARIGLSFGTLTVNAAWQHNFHRPDNYLSLSYQFDFGDSSMPMTEEYSNLKNYDVPWLSHHTGNSNFNRTHTIQFDYSNALSPHATIETGAKAILRHNSAYAFGEGSNDLVLSTPVAEDYSNLTQLQNIYALYALYKASYGAWGAQAGVRYEHTDMGIRYHYGDMSDFTTHLNDIVPDASLSYSISPAHAFGLSYGMRISRPSLEQINPYTVKYSATDVTRGNPQLESERINKISLTYRNFGRIIGTSLSLDFNHTGNAIAAFSYLDGPTVVRTNANIGRKENASLTAFLLINAARNLRLTFNGTGGYTYLRSNGSLDLRNHGWSGNIFHNGEWTLPASLILSWYGGYYWGAPELQTRQGDYFFYGLGLARDFLADKSLRLTVNAANFAQKNLKFSSTTTTPDFITTATYRIASWRIGISATWRFGKTQSQIKSVNTTIINDDLST